MPSTLSGSGYSAEWIGIDGFQNSTVEQVGTEADISGGQTTYYAWYEMYPSDPVKISSITVHPGDTVSASVNYNAANNTFTMTIADGSQTYTTLALPGGNAQRSSAEWIVEAPWSGGVLPLANFGSVAFSNITMNGTAVAASQATGIDMASNRSALKASAGSLTSGGFSVSYDSSGGSGGYGLGGYGYGFAGNRLAGRQAALDRLFGSGFDFRRM